MATEVLSWNEENQNRNVSEDEVVSVVHASTKNEAVDPETYHWSSREDPYSDLYHCHQSQKVSKIIQLILSRILEFSSHCLQFGYHAKSVLFLVEEEQP